MKYSYSIKIPRLLSKITLWLTRFFDDNHVALACKGYDDDYDLYTGLCWKEDRSLDLIGDKTYGDFQLWVRLN